MRGLVEAQCLTLTSVMSLLFGRAIYDNWTDLSWKNFCASVNNDNLYNPFIFMTGVCTSTMLFLKMDKLTIND